MNPPNECPICAASTPMVRHARRPSWWRDVPRDGRPHVRQGDIVRWRCMACRCTCSTAPAWADPSRRMTQALVQWLSSQRQAGLPVMALARVCGLDAKTVRQMGASSFTEEPF